MRNVIFDFEKKKSEVKKLSKSQNAAKKYKFFMQVLT